MNLNLSLDLDVWIKRLLYCSQTLGASTLNLWTLWWDVELSSLVRLLPAVFHRCMLQCLGRM